MANFFDEFSFYRLPFPLPSRTFLSHLRSLFISSQICLLIIIVFFFKRDFYITHIHTHTHIHIYIHNAPMFEQKKEKTFLFEIFSYFELLKRKKISIHRLWKKKISPAKKRLVE